MIKQEELKYYFDKKLQFLTKLHQLKYGERTLLTMRGMSIQDDGELLIEFLYNDDLIFSNQLDITPLFHPLSSLTKPVLEGGKIPIEELAINRYNKDILREKFKIVCDNGDLEIRFFVKNTKIIDSWHSLPFSFTQQLIEWHFWIFDQSYFKTGQLINKSKRK